MYKLFISITVLIVCLSCGNNAIKEQPKVELVLWESQDVFFDRYLDDVIAKFQKTNPEVKVTRQHYASDDIAAKFQSMSIAGTPPDLVFTSSDKEPFFVTNNLVKSSSAFIIKGDYLEQSLWSVPNSRGSVLMLYYNKDYVAHAPKDTAALLKTCRKVMKRKQKDLVTCFEFDQQDPLSLIPFLSSFGGTILKDGVPQLDTKEMRRTFSFIKHLKDKKYISQDINYDDMRSMFKEGKTAMVIDSSDEFAPYFEVMKNKLNVSVLPINSETKFKMVPISTWNGFYISSFVKPDKIIAIKQLMILFNSKEEQQRVLTEYYRLPVLKTAYNNECTGQYTTLLKQLKQSEPVPMTLEFWTVLSVVRQYLSSPDTPVMQKQALKEIKEPKVM